ncbi:MAG: hypothetical protein A2Y14_04085 [Verrucomicrobia bacterium GWF2_51_19]|nr:MAG: hypothetical protein A2Y14_04085 [Verrucomicrobia bacterium GWF2_51_19]HCJ11789.1 hypothetical protein [Opitutae bacterium]
MRYLLLFFPVFLFGHHTTDSETLFSQANEAYQKGSYPEAIALYERCLQVAPSANAHFNIGNAAFQNGDIGRSVLAYERALSLRPFDKGIQHNLRFVRQSKQLSPLPLPTFFQQWNPFPYPLWLCVLAGFFWAFVGLLLAWFYGKRGIAVQVTLGLLLTGLIFAATGSYVAHQRLAYGIVMADSPLKVAPTGQSPSKGTLLAGSWVYILGEQKHDFFVRNEKQEEGWVAIEYLSKLKQ